jgi:hypothetical protein
MSGLSADFDSPSTHALFAFLRSEEDGPVSRELARQFANEILRGRRVLTKAHDLCTTGRKALHECDVGRIVAFEKLHSLIIEDKGRTGDFAEPDIVGVGYRISKVTV